MFIILLDIFIIIIIVINILYLRFDNVISLLVFFTLKQARKILQLLISPYLLEVNVTQHDILIVPFRLTEYMS